MISILSIGYVYCRQCRLPLFQQTNQSCFTALDLVIFAVYRQYQGDHRTYIFLFLSASVILVLIVVLGSGSHNVFSTFSADLTTTFIVSSEPPEIHFQPSCSSDPLEIYFQM